MADPRRCATGHGNERGHLPRRRGSCDTFIFTSRPSQRRGLAAGPVGPRVRARLRGCWPPSWLHWKRVDSGRGPINRRQLSGHTAPAARARALSIAGRTAPPCWALVKKGRARGRHHCPVKLYRPAAGTAPYSGSCQQVARVPDTAPSWDLVPPRDPPRELL